MEHIIKQQHKSWKKIGSVIIVFILLLFLFQQPVAAQEKDTLRFEDLLQMSLEQLMSIEVVIKTQSEKNLSLPFSNFSIVDDKTIYEKGYATLKEVLAAQAGITVIDNGFYLTGGHRGLNGDYSQVLLLVDGRPVNSLYSHQAFIANQFPVSYIQQVEITQGPGTVLYGSETFAGIINIVTKKYEEQSSFVEAQLEKGSFGFEGINFLFSKKREKFRTFGYTRLQRSKGIDFASFVKDTARYLGQSPLYSNGSFLNNKDYANAGENFNYRFEIGYGHFYLGRDFYYSKTEQKGIQFISMDVHNSNPHSIQHTINFLGADFSFKEKSKLNIEYQLAVEKIWGKDINYNINKDLFDSLSLQGPQAFTSEVIHNHFTRYYSQKNSSGSLAHRLFIKSETKIPLPIENSLLKGSLFLSAGMLSELNDVKELAYSYTEEHPDFNDSLVQANLLNSENFKYWRNEIYTQVRKSLLNEKVFLTLGGRYALHQFLNGKLLIRSGLVIQPLPNTYINCSFSEGRFFPSVHQQIIGGFDHFPQLNTNNTLVPADNKSIDIGISQRIKKRYSIAIHTYRMIVENQFKNLNAFFIINDPVKHTFTGIETNVQGNFRRGKIVLSYALGGADTILNIYKHKLSFSGTIRPYKYFHLNLNGQYLSKITTANGNPDIEELIELPGFAIFNLVITSDEFYYKGLKVNLSLAVQNIFNNQSLVPNLLRSGPVSFIQPPRQLNLKFAVKI